MPKAKAKETTTSKVKEAPATKQSVQSNSGWFKKGHDGVQERERLDAVAKMRKEKSVFRFWLKAGEGARIVFVDSEGFYINEHNLAIDGKYGNFFTCTKDFTGECPIDTSSRSDKRPVWTGYYTVIDTREFKKQDGTTAKNTKVLYPAKSTAIRILDDLRKKHGSLAGLVFDVKRYSDKDPNCGISLEYVGKVKDLVAKFGKDADKPYDYEKVLAPPTEEEYAAIGLEKVDVIGSHEDIEPTEATGGETEDDLF